MTDDDVRVDPRFSDALRAELVSQVHPDTPAPWQSMGRGAVAILAAIAVLGGVVTVLTRGSSSPASLPAEPASVAAVAATAGASAASAAVEAWGCRVDLPSAWTSAVAQVAAGPGLARVQVIGADAATGSVLQVEESPGAYRRFVRVLGNERRVILDFGADSTAGVEGLAFDGRYLAFGVGSSPEDLGITGVLLWDSQKEGSLVVLDGPPFDGSAAPPVDATFSAPVIVDGAVFWLRFSQVSSSATLLRYDLAARTTTEAATGLTSLSTLVGFDAQVLWLDGRDAAATLRAVAADGGPGRIPAPWDGIDPRIASIAADTRTLAWTTEVGGLFLWRPDWSSARKVDMGGAENLWDLSVSGDLVAVNDGETRWVLDLRTGSYAAVPGAGGVQATSGSLLVGYPGASKLDPPSTTIVRWADRLPALPACPG